jgi:two-component system osmolarity sensor histidine kinase EnvZ
VQSDITGIAREAVTAAAARAQLEVIAVAPIPMRLRPLALKRAISNLANNAADHGKHVRVTVAATATEASVVVEDNGPGIPPESYDDAFRPFSRLDASRNQNVSGVGLGLTIARDTARAHGGDVTLAKSELGGLRATMRLPLDAERPKGLGDEED